MCQLLISVDTFQQLTNPFLVQSVRGTQDPTDKALLLVLSAAENGLGSTGLKVKKEISVLFSDTCGSVILPPNIQVEIGHERGQSRAPGQEGFIWRWIHGSRFLCCCALGALCTVGDAVKRLCHPHSWNVMHAVHRVCFKREAEGGGGGGEEGRRGTLFGRQGAQGLATRGGVHHHFYYFMKKMKHKTRFPPDQTPPPQKNFSINLFFFLSFWWEIINDDPSRFVWSSADERRGEMCGERRETEGWGWGEVKGQRKKGGTFSEDGRLEKKTEGTITPMFKRLFSAPMTPHTGSSSSSLKSGSGALWHFPPQAHFNKKHFSKTCN